MKKSGFTLVELMVYIGIVGVVVIVAGQAFSNSTKMRLRTENMIKANATVEEAGMLMQEDVAQMGAKSALVTNSSVNSDDAFVSSMVYMDVDGGDSSSFTISSNDGNDDLVMRRMRYGVDGSYESIEEVEWFVNGGKLYRKCKTLQSVLTTVPDDCPLTDPPSVEMVDRVSSFKVIPAKPSVLESDYSDMSNNSPRLLPSADRHANAFRLVARYGENSFENVVREPQQGGSSVTLSGFSTNYDLTSQAVANTTKANQLYLASGALDYNETSSSWKSMCAKVDLEAGEEYELSFRIPFVSEDKSRSFCPGVDHMTVGFRNAENGAPVEDLPDYAFYPPIAKNADSRRSVRFSVKTAKKDLCLAFTFSMYSPTAPYGSITIADLVLSKVDLSHFNFDEGYVPQLEDKKKVKAMRLDLKLNRGGENGVLSLVVPVPSNGRN
jgi:Tfp pilus assembly protein PilE